MKTAQAKIDLEIKVSDKYIISKAEDDLKQPDNKNLFEQLVMLSGVPSNFNLNSYL